MKKLLIIALVFASMQAIAQDGKKKKHHKGDRSENMTNLPAEDIANVLTKKMTLFLDLTKSQQDKIYKINLEKATKRKAMIAECKSKKDSEEMKKPSAEARLKIVNERLDQKILEKAAIKNILNDEQYAKWEKSHARMAMKRKDKKRKPKGQQKKC